jgi:hypothetical protein
MTGDEGGGGVVEHREAAEEGLAGVMGLVNRIRFTGDS